MKYATILLLLSAMAMAQNGYGDGAVGGNVSSIPAGQAGDFKPDSNFTQGGLGQHNSDSGSGSLKPESDTRSIDLANWILIALAGTIFLLFLYRLVISSIRYIRTLICMNNEKQRFFQTPNPYYAAFKRHLLYAPLFSSRHMKEFRPVPWLNMGIIPNTIQTLFITAFVGMNVTLTVIDLPLDGQEGQVLNSLLARSGTMAVVNLIPLVIMAGKNNPLISLLGIPYDVFNMMHRWLGRIVVAELITHAVAWMVSSYQKSTKSLPST